MLRSPGLRSFTLDHLHLLFEARATEQRIIGELSIDYKTFPHDVEARGAVWVVLGRVEHLYHSLVLGDRLI